MKTVSGKVVALQTRLSGAKFLSQTVYRHFDKSAPEVTEFGEITQNKGHYIIQHHSRILVPIESSYATFGSSPEAHLARMVFRVRVRVLGLGLGLGLAGLGLGLCLGLGLGLGLSRVLARCASGLDPRRSISDYYILGLSRTVSELLQIIGQIFAFDRGTHSFRVNR